MQQLQALGLADALCVRLRALEARLPYHSAERQHTNRRWDSSPSFGVASKEREPQYEGADLREPPRRGERAVDCEQRNAVVVVREHKIAAHRLSAHERRSCAH